MPETVSRLSKWPQNLKFFSSTEDQEDHDPECDQSTDNQQSVLEHQESYPEDLNPFGSDDETNKSTNPFGSDSEPEEKNTPTHVRFF